MFLGVDDLESHFEKNPTPIEDLVKMGQKLVKRFMTTEAYENALRGNTDYGFATGRPWIRKNTNVSGDSNAMDIDFETCDGDQVLANTILRMRDSLLHYEFQFAVAEGDIGRAMNVMSVSVRKPSSSPISTDRWFSQLLSGLGVYVHWMWQKQVFKRADGAGL